MSFYTALTGLNSATAQLGVTSNNIANVGTTGFKRSRASRKLGAEAFLSCAGLPVAWHFRHGAPELVNQVAPLDVSSTMCQSRNAPVGNKRTTAAP